MAYPKVNIIIPLYNKASYVIRTLDSVLAQTYTDYECIVVDDGSTDNSLQVVEDWLEVKGKSKELRTRYRLITQENAGVWHGTEGRGDIPRHLQRGGASSAATHVALHTSIFRRKWCFL